VSIWSNQVMVGRSPSRHSGCVCRGNRAARPSGDGVRTVRAGRLAAFLFGLAAVYLVLTAQQLPDFSADRIWAGALTAAATSALLLLLPWHRWPAWASLLPPLWAFVVLAGPVGWYAHALSHYLLLYTLLFLYVGLTQRPGTCLSMLPVALLTLLGVGDEPVLPPLPLLLGPVVVAAVLGEVLAFLVAQQQRAQDNLGRLLEATTELQGAGDTIAASNVIAAVACDLLGAASTTVLLREAPGSDVLVSANTARGAAPVGEIRVDTSTDDSGSSRALRAGQPVFVSDAAADPGLHASNVAKTGTASVLFLPLGAHGAHEGVAVAVFTSRRRRIDLAAQRAAQVLATQAGQVLRRVREAQALHDLASVDTLTGLANRRTLFNRLTELSSGDCLVFLDLDHFKQINDQYGHAEGDAVLRSFASALSQVVREEDMAARYGGEEFALLLQRTDARGALLVLDRLRSVARPGVTFSAGVAVHGGRPATETLAAADAALYDAKRSGRDTTRVADTGPGAPTVVVDLSSRQARG
jgi:diguanylate cyclase (GGDEF)-like protein